MCTLQKVIFGFVMVISPMSINAKPYCPIPFDYNQPNGEIITIKEIGDEHYSFTTTQDDLLLVDSLACYYYADNNGNSTGVVAKNADERSENDIALLETIDQQVARKKHQQKHGLRHGLPQQGNCLKALSQQDRPTISAIANGKKRVVTILVQSSQKAFGTSASDWDAKLNEHGYNKDNHNGCIRDYFLTQSRGKLDVTFDVYGPVNLSKRIEELNDDDLLQEALNGIGTLPEGCDDDNDGYIDCVIIVMAGQDNQSDNGKRGSYTYHNDYNKKVVMKDGKKAGKYILTSERSYYGAQSIDGSGSIIHEFGHVLGLPDLYAPYSTTNSIVTPTYWDVMDMGCYNGWSKDYNVAGTCVPNYSMMQLLSLGWAEPTELTPDSIGQYNLPEIMEGKAYMIRTNKSNEYFILENRQQSDWDKELPGHGLLVWHIYYDSYIWKNKKINETAGKPNWVLEPAASNSFNSKDLSYNSYPGSAKITSIETLTDLDGTQYNVNISHITEQNGYICFSTNGEDILECPCEKESTAINKQVAENDAIIEQTAENEWTITANNRSLQWVVTNINGQVMSSGSIREGSQYTIRLQQKGTYIIKIGEKAQVVRND